MGVYKLVDSLYKGDDSMGIHKLADSLYSVKRMYTEEAQYITLNPDIEATAIADIVQERGRVEVVIKHEIPLDFFIKIRYGQYLLVTDFVKAEEITGYPFRAIKEAICTVQEQLKT